MVTISYELFNIPLQNTGATSKEILDCHPEEIRIAFLDHLINLDFTLVNTNTNFCELKMVLKLGYSRNLFYNIFSFFHIPQTHFSCICIVL